MAAFISRIALELINGPGILHEKLVLLPNQRAELFLREALKEHISDTALLPMFTTVDQFIAQAANLVVVEPLALMVRLWMHLRAFLPCQNGSQLRSWPNITGQILLTLCVPSTRRNPNPSFYQPAHLAPALLLMNCLPTNWH